MSEVLTTKAWRISGWQGSDCPFQRWTNDPHSVIEALLNAKGGQKNPLVDLRAKRLLYMEENDAFALFGLTIECHIVNRDWLEAMMKEEK